MTAQTHSFAASWRLWLGIGVNSLGGPAGQVGVMHAKLVEERKQVTNAEFTGALSFAMVVPGPEAQQLATILGWQVGGAANGLLAGSAFVLPGFATMLVLAITYAQWGDIAWIHGCFTGIQSAVIVLVVAAMVRMARRSITSPALAAITLLAFVAITVFAVPVLAVICLAAVVGVMLARLTSGQALQSDDGTGHGRQVSKQARSAIVTAVLLAGLWIVSIVALSLIVGDGAVAQVATLYARTAVLSFGGAYAAVGVVAQLAVVKYGWITAGQMASGLGLAESTPGPLVLVLEFVAFLAAYQHPGGLPPLVAGCLAAVCGMWAFFIPGTAMALAGAPFVNVLSSRSWLRSGMSGVGAAVVAVIACLALLFAYGTFFEHTTVISSGLLHVSTPDWSTIRWPQVLIALAAALVVWRVQVPTWLLLASSGLAGILLAGIGVLPL